MADLDFDLTRVLANWIELVSDSRLKEALASI